MGTADSALSVTPVTDEVNIGLTPPSRKRARRARWRALTHFRRRCTRLTVIW